MKRARVWMAAGMLAAGLGLVYSARLGAGDTPAPDVLKIAAAVKKGDMDNAKQMAAALVKTVDALEDVMDLFKVKKKGGIAWPGAKDTDGIEAKIREVARDGTKNAVKDAPMFEEIAATSKAIGLVAEAWSPKVKDMGKKSRKAWDQYVTDMLAGTDALSKAAKSKSAAEIKTAATKLNNACNACHSDFRN